MSETRRMVIRLLKSYPSKKTRLDQLHFELDNVTSRSESEIIQELAIRGSTIGGGGSRRGHISDKTMAIAFEYHNISHRMNSEAINEIMRDMGGVEEDIIRIEKYVSLLDELSSNIISLYYFHRKTWDDIETQLGIKKRSLQRYRDSAIDNLASMYSYLADLENQA